MRCTRQRDHKRQHVGTCNTTRWKLREPDRVIDEFGFPSFSYPPLLVGCSSPFLRAETPKFGDGWTNHVSGVSQDWHTESTSSLTMPAMAYHSSSPLYQSRSHTPSYLALVSLGLVNTKALGRSGFTVWAAFKRTDA
jgi:hypothetical protein